jgi:hypothetical protein
MNQYQQKGLLVLVGIITLIVSRFQQGTVETAIFSSFAIISFVLSVFLLAFERFCWKWKWFYGSLVPVPNLNGKWKGSGNETLVTQNVAGNISAVSSKLETDLVTIEQQYSTIHLKIDWNDGGVTRFDQEAPFVVSGTNTKRLSFNAIYFYTPKDGNEESRNVIATISMDSKLFENRPAKFKLTYFTSDGVRQGTINLEFNDV